MTPIFAEASNDTVITWGVILVMTTIAANLASIFGGRKKQKREVSFEEECASKKEFEKHQNLSVESRRRMHEEIRSLERSVTALTTTVDRTQKDVSQLDAKIEGVKETLRTLPGEIIADLRNSGALS